MQSSDADGHEIAALEAAWAWSLQFGVCSRAGQEVICIPAEPVCPPHPHPHPRPHPHPHPQSPIFHFDAGAVIHAPSTRLNSVRFGRLCCASLYFTLAFQCRESRGFPRRRKKLEQRGVYVIRLGSLASWPAPKTFRIFQPRMPIFS